MRRIWPVLKKWLYFQQNIHLSRDGSKGFPNLRSEDPGPEQTHRTKDTLKWEKQNSNTLKVNWDASTQANYRKIDIISVVRIPNGEVLAAMSVPIQNTTDSTWCN